MNKLVILIAIIFLLILILCLKISLVEYFANSCEKVEESLKQLDSSLGIKVDINDVKDKCPDELEKACNDKAVDKIIDELKMNNISAKNLPELNTIPETIEDLYGCIMNNGIMSMDGFDMSKMLL
jgi:hypothetical protein